MSGKIKLTAEEMRYIALFESITGATAKDCLIDNHQNKLIFVTKEHEAGLAVGKNGGKVKTLKRVTGRDIEIVEYAVNLQDFIKNAFMPARIKEIRVTERLDGKKIVVVKVHEADKGMAIGRGGEKAARTRQLAKRYFGVDNIVIV
ncbi:NusA-like transcription termination signal-binding factor [Candidatus Hecatella orcuttiae]|uniref:NusA-like transcription termination signal-binding factor n=1 Tax=Candidatus Hecatella orcuttiae TaxID=1935119 RepID=UPI0028680555|nr:NusA-like transcription termination signal-binding factor [Candidatus Hecatella orcuttiae]